MRPPNRSAFLQAGLLALLFTLVCGCGKSKPGTDALDAGPFKKAIAEYLERNNMAMALKEVKDGPKVQDKTATLTASLVHATMGGPAVTWEFTFEKAENGAWRVVRHTQ